MNSMPIDDGLLDRVRDKLAGELSNTESTDTTPEVIAAAIRAEARGVLGDADLLVALRHLQTELTGAGRLEQLLAEPDIADVLVSGPDQVWVDRGHGLQRTDIVFDDEPAVRRLAARLALNAGKRLDDAQPWVDGQLSNVGRRGYIPAVFSKQTAEQAAPFAAQQAAFIGALQQGYGRFAAAGFKKVPCGQQIEALVFGAVQRIQHGHKVGAESLPG